MTDQAAIHAPSQDHEQGQVLRRRLREHRGTPSTASAADPTVSSVEPKTLSENRSALIR